jgi:hypothetical protein
MHDLILMTGNGEAFDRKTIERIFESEGGFSDVRFNEPGGAAIEADVVVSVGGGPF